MDNENLNLCCEKSESELIQKTYSTFEDLFKNLFNKKIVPIIKKLESEPEKLFDFIEHISKFGVEKDLNMDVNVSFDNTDFLKINNKTLHDKINDDVSDSKTKFNLFKYLNTFEQNLKNMEEEKFGPQPKLVAPLYDNFHKLKNDPIWTAGFFNQNKNTIPYNIDLEENNVLGSGEQLWSNFQDIADDMTLHDLKKDDLCNKISLLTVKQEENTDVLNCLNSEPDFNAKDKFFEWKNELINKINNKKQLVDEPTHSEKHVTGSDNYYSDSDDSDDSDNSDDPDDSHDPNDLTNMKFNIFLTEKENCGMFHFKNVSGIFTPNDQIVSKFNDLNKERLDQDIELKNSSNNINVSNQMDKIKERLCERLNIISNNIDANNQINKNIKENTEANDIKDNNIVDNVNMLDNMDILDNNNETNIQLLFDKILICNKNNVVIE